MLEGEYIHEDAIRQMVKAMMVNELEGMQKRDGKIVNIQYITSFANRLIKNILEKEKRGY